MYIGKFPRKKKTEEDFIFMFMFMFCDKIGSEVSIYRVTLFAENLIIDSMSFFSRRRRRRRKDGIGRTFHCKEVSKQERKKESQL